MRMGAAGWQAEAGDVEALVAARHGDSFAVLGLHETPAGWAIRALVPGAEAVEAIDADGRVIAGLALRDGAGSVSYTHLTLPTICSV